MSENYFEKPGVSSSKLKTFYAGGKPYHPESLILAEQMEAEGNFWVPVMENGNALEALVMDTVAGGLGNFLSRFYISDQANECPEIVGREIASAKTFDVLKERLEKLIVLNKPDKNGKQKRSGKHTKRHAYIDEIINLGEIKYPISQNDYAELKFLAESMCEIPIPREWWNCRMSFGEFFSVCSWQKEMYWEQDGIPCKSMPDASLEWKGTIPMFDFKWTGNLSQWLKGHSSGGWVQAQHYETGALATTGLKPLPYLFLIGVAAEKRVPAHVTYCWADPGECTRKPKCFCDECRQKEYEDLLAAYHKWTSEGKPAKGWRAGGPRKVWV